MADKTVHRILPSLMMREVARVTEHVIEAVSVDIGADRLEVETSDAYVSSNIVRGLQLELGVCLGRRKRRASVETIHVLGERAHPVTGEFGGTEDEVRVPIEHTAEHHRHQIVLHLQMNVREGPWIEREFGTQHPPLEGRRIA